MTTNERTACDALMLANHSPTSRRVDIEELCDAVLQWRFAGAFVNPVHVRFAAAYLQGRAPVGSIVGFTLGQDSISSKLEVLRTAIVDGADELDMYPNTGAFFDDPAGLATEIRSLVGSAKDRKPNIVTRIVLDPGLMESTAQMEAFGGIIADAGADFVKIGSGFGPRAPSLDDVRTVRRATNNAVQIKVAGGVRTLRDALAFVAEGVTRIGSSSAIRIVQEAAGMIPEPTQGGGEMQSAGE